MGDMIALTYEAYKLAYKEFIREYDSYSKRNIERTNDLACSVYTEEPDSVYLKLQDVIHKTCILYDKKIIKCKLSQDEKGFMSGVKHVDNIIKHEDSIQDIAELIASASRISSIVSKVTVVPKMIMNLRLVNVWADLSKLPLRDKDQRKRANYNKYLKKETLDSTVGRINEIVDKYY